MQNCERSRPDAKVNLTNGRRSKQGNSTSFLLRLFKWAKTDCP
jgi:hypothetical protein